MKTRLFLQLPGLVLTTLLTLLVGQGVAFGHEGGDKSVSQRTALRKHPQVGAWLLLNAPSGPSTVIFSADGTVVFGTQATQAGTFNPITIGMREYIHLYGRRIV